MSENSDEIVLRGENRNLDSVSDILRFPSGFVNRGSQASEDVAGALMWLQESRPTGQNHWPALCLALVAQIEALAFAESVQSFASIFDSNPPEVAAEGRRAVNTLNFTTSSGESIKLRPFYNEAMNTIRNVMLREHPSNPGHATQSWPSYRPLIEKIAKLNPEERKFFAQEVWRLGVIERPVLAISTITERAIRPFEVLLREMPTQVGDVRGGAILQGIAFGYLRADSPNLILESHKVNTGSSRAGMLGDVDGFRGREPELAAEVKDLHLSEENFIFQLGDFFADIEHAPNVTSVVICRSVTPGAREAIERKGVTILDKNDLLKRVAVWDVPKQQEAIRGLEYYLGRVQRSDSAVTFLRSWLLSKGIQADIRSVFDPEQKVAE